MGRKLGGRRVANIVGVLTLGASVVWASAGIAPTTAATSSTSTTTSTSPATIVSDSFGRTVAAGWGSAAVGGAYSVANDNSSASVDGTGRLVLNRKGASSTATLSAVDVRDVDMTFRVSSNKTAAGGAQRVLMNARHVSTGNEYRSRVFFANDGSVAVDIARMVNGSLSLLVSRTTVAGLERQAGASMLVRFRVTGSSPTNLQVKTWLAGASEPTGWAATATDSTTALAAPGEVSVGAFLPNNTANAPIVFTYDDLTVTDLAPGPDPTPTPTPTSTPTPTPTSTPTASPSPAPTPTTNPTATPTPTATVVPTATPTPMPTAVPTPVPTAAPTSAPPTGNVFYISPTGDDSRTSTQARSSSTPWKTPMRAYHDAAVVDGSTIMILNGTWTGADAGLHSKINQNGNNESKRVTFEVAAGATAIFEVLHGTGVDRVNTGSSYLWLFINPKGVVLKRGAGAAFIFRDTPGSGWPADAKQENTGAEDTSALAFVIRTNNAGPTSANNCLVDGVTVQHWMGNGIMFKDVQGCHAHNVEVSGTSCGVRIQNVDGARVKTTLAAPAATGATSVTLATGAGVNVGDMLRIGTGATTQPRIVTAVNGSSVTLGGYAYPGGPLLNTFPLEYGFASGAPAVTQFGLDASSIHDNYENTRGLANPVNGDVGGEGTVFAKGTRNAAMWNNEVYNNYDWRMGSVDYNIDGTGTEPYAMKALSWNIVAWSSYHDNHAFIETGTDSGQLSNGNDDGGMVVYRNYVWGKIDFQNASPINPLAAPTAAWMLLRASPNWVIRQNTFYITNGPAVGQGSNRGGLRFRSGGQYGGTRDGMTILDNIFATTVDSRAYDYTTIGSFPASHVNDYNLLWRPNGGSDPAAVSPSGVAYSLNSTGLANWRSQTGFGMHDKWQVNPLFVAPGNGDYRLQAGSPAIGAASWGGDMGAAVYLP